MANSDKREALRGVAEVVLDHIFEAFSSEQWAELLKAPLERAAGQGDQGLARKLVEAGADMEYALGEAVGGRHRETATNLLEIGASFDKKDTQNRTFFLHNAAKNGDAEMIRLLLLHGADKDGLSDEGCSALCGTVCGGYMAATQALLTAGAGVNIECDHDGSVLHSAVYEGSSVDVLRALLEAGVDVESADAEGSTALHWSAIYSTQEVIDALVEAGANVHARDDTGATPLHAAAWVANQVAVLAFLKHGAEVNVKDNIECVPLHFAAFGAGRQGTARMVDLLLRWGADETVGNEGGETPTDVIGEGVAEQDRLAHDFERVQKLLANAPADRAWRRRGYMVLCRAHLDRLQMTEGGEEYDGLTGRTRSRAELAAAKTSTFGEGGGGGTSGAIHRGSWTAVLARVLRFEEDGIFRSVVGFL